MKILFISDRTRVETYKPNTEFAKATEYMVMPIDASEDEIIAAGNDAEVVVVDAICPFTKYEIEHMPKLKLIHSEGVAYNQIDMQTAQEHGIYVCNQKGANAIAVAEQTILLMLALLRHLLDGYEAVKAGHQIETKTYLMSHGIYELNEMKVGLIGFGDIGKEVARLLIPFGVQVYYYQRHRLSKPEEKQYQATYLALDDLLKTCNLISMHVPVTPETVGMCDSAFFEKMQDQAYFINTARGEIVVNQALVEALQSGKLAGVGLDTLAPEPVQKEHPLLHLPVDLQQKIIISPHIGGCTSGFFHRAHQMIWENAQHIAKAEKPIHIVNGL